MRTLRPSTLLLGALAAVLCFPLAAAAQTTKPNVLLIIIDDMGVEMLGAYNQNAQSPEVVGPTPPEHQVTPRIDQLAQQGVLFRNAWSAPICKPTRTALITGRYGVHTAVLDNDDNVSISPDPEMPTLPERLPPAYVAEAIGKWHITPYITTPPPPPRNPPEPWEPWEYGDLDRPPTVFGFNRHQGDWRAGGPYKDFHWADVGPVPPNPTDLILPDEVNYLTTRDIDTAIAFVQGAQEPWFLWLAVRTAHAQWVEDHTDPHLPPTSTGVCDDISGDLTPTANRRVRCKQLEILDHELGRLLDEISLQNTTVFLMGDNGTPRASQLEQIPGKINRDNKGEIYEGGINVPLIVAGFGVAGDSDVPPDFDEKSALVHAVDVLPTALHIAAGTAPSDIDGVTFQPVLSGQLETVRSCVYADGRGFRLDPPNHAYRSIAVRNATHKLIRRPACLCIFPPCAPCPEKYTYEFRNLVEDPSESAPPLANTGTVFDGLKAQLDQLDADPDFSPCKPSCGIGPELVPALLLLSALRRRRPSGA